MGDPKGSRPYMPGYGLLDAAQGTGLLPWSWAVERLERSHDYWVATIRPDGRPHVMPVWGIWLDSAVWFSSSRRSRKARNLSANQNCAITTDNAYEPVIIEGAAVEPGQLHKAQSRIDLLVVVGMEANLLRIKGLGPVNVRYRHCDEFEFPIHEMSLLRSSFCGANCALC